MLAVGLLKRNQYITQQCRISKASGNPGPRLNEKKYRKGRAPAN